MIFEDDTERTGWTVPTGPFVGGVPTPIGTSAQQIQSRTPGAPPPGSVVFNLNNGMGLTSGCFNGTACGLAEPSGASNGGSVVFASANYVEVYSTDGGNTFHQLDPTTIFPNDAVGYCCDQVVQYAPSIDRFIWLLQGASFSDYRLAVASPADVANSGGTAWTYWNLTPNLFGDPAGSGVDYPDMSLGDNYLYISWDATSCQNCQGRQVIRIPLSQLQAGGTINIDYTHPADSTMVWAAHLTQDTRDEIFWAGHLSNSSPGIRVFSWAENPGSYFWRDVGVLPAGPITRCLP